MRKEIPIEFSQNFLKYPSLAKKLVDLSSIKKDDIVYEIGPGKGILTEFLSKKAGKVIAIEKDGKLCKKLKEKFSKYSNVEIKCGDFLKEKLPINTNYKVFSNIPFFITAEIMKKLTQSKNPPIDSYLGIQEEAAKRYTGTPYGKETLSSLLLKPWFEFKIIYRFKRNDFYPPPRINVVFLQIKKREFPLVEKEKAKLYKDFVVYGFTRRKPTLKKAFKKIFTFKQFLRLSKDLKFKMDAKPTDLNFNQWLPLFNYFLIGVEDFKKNLVKNSEKRLLFFQSRLQKIHRTRC